MNSAKGEQSGSFTTRVGKRGTLVIPAGLRRQAGLEDGTAVVAEARDGGIFIRPLTQRFISPERRRAVLDAANRAYAALSADQAAADQMELAAWDTLAAETLPSEAWSEDDFLPER